MMLLNENFSSKLRKLASKLVSSLTDFDVGSDNHESCVEYSLSNFYYHRFLTPDSDKVHRQVNGLVDKFLVHSQPEKSKSLKEMFHEYLESDLSDVSFCKSSVHYSLISILLNLSEKPLYHNYEKIVPSVTQEVKDSFDWTAHLLDGEDNPTNWPWNETPPDSDDELVSTIDAAELLPSDAGPDVKPKPFKVPMSEPSFADSNLVQIYWKLPKVKIKPALNCSLKTPSSVMLNDSNITEANVIREVLWLLSGHSDLFVFPFKNGQHAVSQHVHLSHLSNSSLQETLNIFASCGDVVTKLRKFVFSTSLHVSSTYEAFAASLSKYLDWLISDLVEIENKVKLQKDTFLLQDLHESLSSHTQVLQLLNDVYDCSISTDSAEETNSVKTSRLLRVLYQSLLDESDIALASADPIVELTPIDVLFNLWLDSVKPYIDITDKWISKGVLEDEKHEFVISKDTTDCHQPSFWYEALVTYDDVEKTCPWLSPLLTTIVAGGKSMEILKTLSAMLKQSEKGFQDVLSSVNEVLSEPVYKYILDDLNVTAQSILHTQSDAVIPHEIKSSSKDVLLRSNFTRLISHASASSTVLKMDKHFVNSKPLSVLINKALRPVIELKCNYANRRLVEVFKDQFELLKALNQFHNFHLMAWGDAMHQFTVGISEYLLSSDAILSDLVGVNILMQEALSYTRSDEKVFVQLRQQTIEQEKDGGVDTKTSAEKTSHHLSIDVTDCIELHWKVDWPISLVLNEKCIQIYNKVFSYLLQIKRALFCVESLKFSTIYRSSTIHGAPQRRYGASSIKAMTAEEKRHRMAILRARILHLLQHWHGFVMTSVIQAEKHVFSTKFYDAKTMDDILSAHNVFLERILSLCLLNEANQASKLVQGTLRKIMTLSITFNLLWNSGIEVIQDRTLLKHESAFHECSEFLGRILKTIANRGAVPILDSLAYSILS